jgi:hypothetical protein
MSKSVWLIISMGAVTILVLSVGMMISLNQFQEIPAAEWVKLAQATGTEFKFENVTVRVSFRNEPSTMAIAYVTRQNSKFDTSAQKAEMEKVAQFAVQNYKGRDLNKIDQVQVHRSEIHGSGCFQTTYVADHTAANPKRQSVQQFQLPGRER